MQVLRSPSAYAVRRINFARKSCSRSARGALAGLGVFLVGVGGAMGGCNQARDLPTPTFREEVAPLLQARCVSCHDGATPSGGWAANSYLAVIGCVSSDGAQATRTEDSPILRVLTKTSHASIVTDDERDVLTRWIQAGAPAFRGGVHPPSWVDPRSPQSHARWLRARRWVPMLDAQDVDACGKCHEGAPARTDPPRSAAPGATACTSCHTEKNGPLACTTCHGGATTAIAYPPRDACFFPDDRRDVTHAAHVEKNSSRSEGIACVNCHPTPTVPGDFSATHGDGKVEVWLAGGGEQYDPETRKCTPRCHSGLGAARPTPAWGEAKIVCGDCHSSPPPSHYKGDCSKCHAEANADGTALVATTLHLNGRVDRGDGSGRCGSCHGTGDDPAPKTGAHKAHISPKSSVAVACATCHVVPASQSGHPRGAGSATVTFSGLATKGGLAPTFDKATGTCANVYCHSHPGATVPAPRWTQGADASACGGCHSLPPAAPHTSATSCGTGACHRNVVSGLELTKSGAAHHVDGLVDLSVP